MKKKLARISDVAENVHKILIRVTYLYIFESFNLSPLNLESLGYLECLMLPRDHHIPLQCVLDSVRYDHLL